MFLNIKIETKEITEIIKGMNEIEIKTVLIYSDSLNMSIITG